ncbi:MAG: hypothetical protein DWQ36_22070 [Acidobacteria bacterium]|nr:MAG: hypothetical protein DWQ30_00470 [Acidobacteriota bacterium]REK00876.1 MAG: hypothetical protein DWQ36_22070 [Acidobacteriota bacterium]
MQGHADVAAGKLSHIQELVKANQIAETIGPTPPSQVAFAEAFVYVKVYSNDKGFKLPSGAYAKFDGTAWGAAFGGGVTWMTAVFAVPESQIFGDVSFNFNSAGGQTNLNFWRGSTFIGSAVGAGLGVSIGVSGGSGTFKKG